MPEHASVLPRTRRGASSRPLAAALSIALALLGITAFALPASADDAPPAGDVAPVVEPTASPEPGEPAPEPSAPAPEPSSAPSLPSALGSDPAPVLLLAAPMLAAPAPAASPILGPTTITVDVGQELPPVTYTAPGYSTPRLRGTLPAGLDDDRNTWRGELVIDGTPTAAGSYPVTVYVGSWPNTTARLDVTIVVRDPATITGPDTITGSLGSTVRQSFTLGGTPAPSVTLSQPLPAGLTWRVSGNRLWIEGVPTVTGPFATTITVANADGSATKDVAFTITGLAVGPAPDLYLPLGVAMAPVLIPVVGYPTPTVWITGQQPPTGIVVEVVPGGVRVSGTPTTVQSRDIRVNATSGSRSESERFTISVGNAPTITVAPSATTSVSGATNVPITLTGSQVTLTSAAPLPSGLRFIGTGANRALTGTPTQAAVGDHTITLTATNAYGTATATLQLTVQAPPELVSSQPMAFPLGQESSFTLTTRGWPAPQVTATGLPAGVALEQVDATTWQVRGTVTDPAALGSRTVTVSLTNDAGTASRTLPLRVEGFAWTAGPSEVVVEAGVPMTPFVVSSAAFPFSAYITPTGIPAGITCSWFSWTDPTPTVRGTDNSRCSGTVHTVGTFTVVFRSDIYPQTYIHPVTIRVVVRPVVVAPATATVVAETDASIPVTVTGNPAPTTVTATGLPDGLSIQPVAGSGWAIVGRADRSAVGDHDVTIRADNGLAATRSLVIHVESLPVLPTGDVALVVGTPYSGSVTADGSPSPTLAMTAGDLPDGLSWSAAGPVGTLAGTPTETGAFTYTVTATNTHGTTTQTYHVEVQEAAAFADDTLSLTMVEGVAASRTLPLAGFPYPAVTPSGSIPDGMTVAYTPGTAPVLSGTPAPGSAGTYTLVLTAGNHTVLGDTTDAVTIEVTVQAAPTLAAIDPLEGVVGTVVDQPLVVGGSPAPAVTATGLPAGVELRQDPGGQWHLAGTPAPGTGGRHTVTVTVDNGVLTPATATTTLTVREPVTGVVAPVANLRAGTPAVVTVRAHGGWPTPAALSVIGTLPDGLRFVDQGDGTGQVLGTPTAAAVGSWQVTILGDNGVGTARTTLTLAVAAAPAPAVSPAAPALAAAPAPVPSPTPAPTDTEGTDPATGDGDGGTSVAEEEVQAAPPVLDPEETITVERTPRPWWWLLGAVLVGAVLLGLRTLERKLRGI